MNEKFMQILGWVATLTAMAMYFSYIPQISGNLNNDKGDWLQPLVAAINCSLWVMYGLIKKPKRDWPIVVANSPGILFGFLTFATAL
ncbi:SemiSWEET family transporter [Flavobacterium sp. B17]|uniref:SemiSWEET family transporter n=1 Tax=Flavobacterium sp. B17 TaxID=95618 RepID=UPI0005B28429